MKKLFFITLLFLMMAACTKEDEPASVTAITFNQSEYKVYVPYNADGTVDMNRIGTLPLAEYVIISPKDAPKSDLKWKSSNTEVATINAEGMVTALKAGETTITVSAGGISASCLIKCIKTIDLKSISFLDPVKMENGTPILRLFPGRKVNLQIKLDPAEVAELYVTKWSSDNNEVVTVDEKTGDVTAVGTGETYVTVTLYEAADEVNGQKHARSCKVIVEKQKDFELCWQAGSTFKKGKYTDAWSFEEFNGYEQACADGKDIYYIKRDKDGNKYRWRIFWNSNMPLYQSWDEGEITAFWAKHDYVATAIKSTLYTLNPHRYMEKKPIVVVDGGKEMKGVIATSRNKLAIASDGTVYALVRVDDGTGTVAAMTRYTTDGKISSYRVPYNVSASSLVMDENENVYVFVQDKNKLHTYRFDGQALTITNSMDLTGNVSSLSCCCRNGSVYIMCISGFQGRTGKIFRDYKLLFETSSSYTYGETAIDVTADGRIFYCFDRKIFQYADGKSTRIAYVNSAINYFAVNYLD